MKMCTVLKVVFNVFMKTKKIRSININYKSYHPWHTLVEMSKCVYVLHINTYFNLF